MRAVCVRCGSEKPGWDTICPGCGHRPEGEGLLVAWLLSDQHLGPTELQAAAARVRHGRPVRPSDRQLDLARRALGVHANDDPGLPLQHQVALLATSVLITGLVGVVMWGWWREERPRSARRALALSLPVTVVFSVIAVSRALGWAS
jgi:hypothetical protein